MSKPLPIITESPEHLQRQLRAETEAKKRARLQALYLVAGGQATSRLMPAKWLAVHRHTRQTGLKLYEGGGLKALLTLKKVPGKTPAVSPHGLTKLQEQLATARGFGSYGEVQQDWVR